MSDRLDKVRAAREWWTSEEAAALWRRWGLRAEVLRAYKIARRRGESPLIALWMATEGMLKAQERREETS